jgi:hypothetical protein
VSVLVLATSRLVVGAVATLVARRRVGRLLLVGAVVEAFRTGTYLYATLRGASDQSRNPIAAIRRNADAEGLTDRIDLVTGDMRACPSTTPRSTLSPPACHCTTSPTRTTAATQ